MEDVAGRLSVRGLYWWGRDLFARPSSESWSPEDEEQWRRELEEYEGPIGREGTVWGHGPGVHPEDQAAWEWLGEDVPAELEEWADRVRSAMPRLPAESILYDLRAGLGLDGVDSVPESTLRARVTELHHEVLEAFRRATAPDEWLYAIDEPEESCTDSYRFWPHRATETTKWYVSPVPSGDDEYFVAADFSWGLLGLFGGFSSQEWQVCVFGRHFLDALAQDPPRAFSTVLEGDAFSQQDPTERDLESKTSILMFTLGLNCQLARDHGVWSRDLERRYRKLQRLEERPGRAEEHLELVAGLIARVELALDEAGVEYQSALSHLDE
jgi:Protein of unknown function (DUF2716)